MIMKEPFVASPSQLELTPAVLVEHCLQGDAGAWRLLVARYARLVHSVPARYGLSSAEVEDVGQDVFLALSQSLHTIDDPDRLPAWLVTTTRRVCWRLLQRRTEQPLDAEAEGLDGHPLPNALISPLPTPEAALTDWNRQALLHEAMERLGERCRELIALIFLDPHEPNYDEISARLNIPKGSIGPTRRRCLQQLRAQLSQDDFNGDD